MQQYTISSYRQKREREESLENAPKNGMQKPVKVERKRNVGQKMLKRFAKKSMEGRQATG
jgi:hypothetical protein